MASKIKSLAKYCIYFEFIYMILVNSICDFFVLPNFIKYLPDISTIFLIFYMLLNLKEIVKSKKIKHLFVILSIFLIITLISFFINMYSPFLYFWGLRRILRFFTLFFASYIVLEEKDVDKYLKIINILYIINILIIILQYFVFGLRRDYIGGTFSFSHTGGNVSLIPFLLINLFIFFSKYETEKINLLRFVLYIIPILIIAAIAELKMVFIVFIFTIMLVFLFSRKNLTKNITLLVISVVFIVLGVKILISLYPEWNKYLNISNIVVDFFGSKEYGYSTAYDLSRGKAIIQINERVFKNSYINYLFGYGLGNCDYSSINLFNSPFYVQYGNVLHHTWFVQSIYYLETGGLGLLAYIAFFMVNIVYSIKIYRKYNLQNEYRYKLLTPIFCSFTSILLIVYNEFLKIDTSFFWYIALSIPYIIDKKELDDEK